jgi:muramoyltetrapeptide carboxypeptidase
VALILPRPLRPGDVVRVVAPSGPFEPALLEAGLRVLRERLGLRPRLRDDVAARAGYLAGDDARRAEEWREAALDPEARAIWCARGGYGAMRILPSIDPRPLLDRPRWVIGFSDVTAIHAVLNRAGLATVHGPVLTQLGRLAPAALDHLEALLFGRAAAAEGAGPPGPGAGLAGTTIQAGAADGTLVGGSLTLLAHLCGTPFLPPLAGSILFVEDVAEKPYRLDRYLTQLRLAGALEGVRAICVGQLTGCDAPGESAAATVRALVRALGVPAIEALPAGHEDDNRALLLGAPARVVAPGPGDPGVARVLFAPPAGAIA